MIALYILLLIILGFSLTELLEKVNILDNSLNIYEKIGFSIINGLFAFSLYFFVIGSFGFELNRYIFIPIYTIAIVYIIYFLLTKQIKINKHIKTSSAILVVSLVIILMYCISSAYSTNFIHPDEFSAWGLNAKNIFISKQLDMFIGTGLETYPYMLPILYSSFFIMTNTLAENAVRVLPSIFYIGMIFSIIGLSKRHNIKFNYVIITFIFTTLFYTGITQFAFSSYGDMPFAVFYTLSILYLYEWLFINRNKSMMFLSILFANGACWTKIDGLPMLIFHIGIICLYNIIKLFDKENKLKDKIKIRNLIIYIISIFIVAVCWKIYTNIAKFPISISSGNGTIEVNLKWLNPLLSNMALQQFSDYVWSIFFCIFGFSLFRNWTKFSYPKKVYIIFGILNIIFVSLFLMVCYLVKFGAEATIAASYIRYLSRSIFIFEYLTLYCLSDNE